VVAFVSIILLLAFQAATSVQVSVRPLCASISWELVWVTRHKVNPEQFYVTTIMRVDRIEGFFCIIRIVRIRRIIRVITLLGFLVLLGFIRAVRIIKIAKLV
jgi:hypothetical protein